jgi:hypothetical protein
MAHSQADAKRPNGGLRLTKAVSGNPVASVLSVTESCSNGFMRPQKGWSLGSWNEPASHSSSICSSTEIADRLLWRTSRLHREEPL